jgi:hypothetical protein
MKKILISLTSSLVSSLICLFLFFNCAKAEDQPFNLPFKVDVNTLYDFQHKTLTAGLAVDMISIYDTVFIGLQAVGSAEQNFFKNGILGGQVNVDINKTMQKLATLAGANDVKWLLGKYTPRIGYALTYNFMGNDYYKQFNHFITLKVLSF